LRDSVYIGALASAAPGSRHLLYHRDHIKGFALAPVGATESTATAPVWSVTRHLAVDGNATYNEALRRDARGWRDTLSRVYKTQDGVPIAPTTQELWQSSERAGRVRHPDTLSLAPVAMFVHGDTR